MRRRARLAGAFSLVGTLLAGSSADAQDAATAPAEAAPSAEDAEAQSHFEAGRAYHDRGEFEGAAREFRVAYELSGRPELLFNMSLAYRDGGMLPEAIDSLERYLASELPGPDRARLERRLEAMRADLAARDSSTPSARAVAGVATAGAGALALIGALITGIVAIDARSTLDEQYCDAARTCAPGFETALDDARSWATATNVLIGTGAALVAAGAALFVVGLVVANDTEASVACDGAACVATIRGAFP